MNLIVKCYLIFHTRHTAFERFRVELADHII